MLFDAMEKLIARRAALLSEISKIDSLIKQHEKLMADVRAVVDEIVAAVPAAPVPPLRPSNLPSEHSSASRRKTRGPNGSPADEIVKAVIDVLNEAQRPMTRYELVDAVEAKGLIVGGADKPRNMGTILWRANKFENGGQGYWLDGDPPQPADSQDDEIDEILGG